MSLRFQRRISLGAGVRLNLSKSGVGLSVGRAGSRFSLGPSGGLTTLGVPGTGLSWRQGGAMVGIWLLGIGAFVATVAIGFGR